MPTASTASLTLRLLHVLPDEVDEFADAAQAIDQDSDVDVPALKRKLRKSLKNPVLLWLKEAPKRGEKRRTPSSADVCGVLAYEIKPQPGKTKQPRKVVATTFAARDEVAAAWLLRNVAKTAADGEHRLSLHVSLACVATLSWLRRLGVVEKSETHPKIPYLVVLEVDAAKAAKIGVGVQ